MDVKVNDERKSYLREIVPVVFPIYGEENYSKFVLEELGENPDKIMKKYMVDSGKHFLKISVCYISINETKDNIVNKVLRDSSQYESFPELPSPENLNFYFHFNGLPII